MIQGGVLSGHEGFETTGLDADTLGITVVPVPTKHTFVSFAQPGFNWHSFSRSFLSAVRPAFQESYSTALRGEERPCVSCGFCEDVCPAGLMPFLLERYLRHDLLERADAAQAESCVRCGLCSYVCLSKIDLRHTICEGLESLRSELRSEGGVA